MYNYETDRGHPLLYDEKRTRVCIGNIFAFTEIKFKNNEERSQSAIKGRAFSTIELFTFRCVSHSSVSLSMTYHVVKEKSERVCRSMILISDLYADSRENYRLTYTNTLSLTHIHTDT